MKSLVVYYSRTGTTKKVAEIIAEKLSADIEEIIDIKGRSGPIGYIIAGKDGAQENLTTIGETKFDPSDYDLVVIGTPIWAGKMASGVRTYITEKKEGFGKIALFITAGGENVEGGFQGLKDLCGKHPEITFSLRTKEVQNEDIGERVQAFVDALTE